MKESLRLRPHHPNFTVARRFTVGVFAALVLAASPAALADSLTFNPTKDATVKAKFPTTNFGADTILQTSAQAGFEKQTFLQFTVSGIPTGATNITAQLKLQSQTTGTSWPVTAHKVTSTSWSETGVTWNTKPALGTTLSTDSSHTAGADSIWDVTAQITGNGTFSLGLDSTVANDTTFVSREGTPQPRLVVTYTPPSGSTRQAAFVKNYGGFSLPATGALWGADDMTRDGTSLDIEGANELNKRIAIHNRHYGVKVTVPTAKEQSDANLTGPKVIPMISLMGAAQGNGAFPVFTDDGKGWDTATVNGHRGLDRITAGEWDGYLDSIATNLNALGVPVILRLWMEMNGSHNPYFAQWQGGVGTGEAKFRAAWQHVWNRFNAKGATLAAGGHIIFCFCPQAFVNAGDWRNYWPGDQYVDWAGIDTYRNTFADDVDNPAAGQDYLEFFTHSHNGAGFNHTVNKPLLICEGGWTQGDVNTAGDGHTYSKDGAGAERSYVDQMRTDIKANPDVIGYVAWNNQGSFDDFIDTGNSLIHYKNWVNDAWFTLYRQ